MITFVTLFLGLVLGLQTVEVMTSEDVARVELLLDGEPVAALTARPWRTAVDLGPRLAPRRLEAVGRDAVGRPVAHATQWLNVWRQPAELEILLEPGVEGRGAVAHLSWGSIAGSGEPTVTATFDGNALPVADPRRLELPVHDPRALHFLRVEASFSEHVGTVAERVFGGTYADQLSTALTAVPVQLTGRAELPPPADLAAWLTAVGEPLPVLAVDDGPADLVVVRDPAAQEGLDAMASTERRLSPGLRTGIVSSSPSVQFVAPLKGDHRVRFLSPHARPVPRDDHRMSLFEPSETLTGHDGGLFWLLTRVRSRLTPAAAPRLADAVAAAGLMAAGGSRPRAVLLVLGPRPVDGSSFTPTVVRGYLEALRVPLVVWSVGGHEGAHWGPSEIVDSLGALERAAKGVRRLLDRQRILWIAGVHLPQEIELSERARAFAEPVG